jgi:putative exosortase-associated protein (TIGR04073 family)
MKYLILAVTIFAMSGLAQADIQAPPGSNYTSMRKLGRGISNVLYSVVEIPEQITRKNEQYGRKAGYSYGVVDGSNRFLRRLGYGVYEIFTFYCPTYHGTYKPPYQKCGQDWRIEMNPHEGLSEFPPELGFETHFTHTRSQKY